MTRAHTLYADGAKHSIAHHGIDVSTPVAGWYRCRLRSGAVRRGVRLHYGPPLDPITGDELDRSWRWQATLDDGSLVNLDDVWPVCADEPISEAEFRSYCERARWAAENAPNSAYADARKRIDPLSLSEPLPF